MKQINIILVLGMILSLLSCHQKEKEKDTIRLFYLGGQSNMNGYGNNSDLPDSLNIEFDNVWIFHGNSAYDDAEGGGLGVWKKLTPGHGTGFSSDGETYNLSDRFGVELSFAKVLQEKYPDERIAIIKYAKEGTSIDSLGANSFGSWDPDYVGSTGINQYDHFLKTVENALSIKDINDDSRDDVLIPSGILWMQGESDSDKTVGIALEYYDNLSRLMGLIRKAFNKKDMPVVIGKISDSFMDKNDGKALDYADIVHEAQEEFVKNDSSAAIIRNTLDYNFSDPWHFDSFGYIDLGKEFADNIYILNNK